MTGLCLPLPPFRFATGPCLLGRSLEACLFYRYRTFSTWVQWEHLGSLSQIRFKCMFASQLLNLASFSHWRLQQRVMHLLSREQDHSMVLKISNVSSGGVQSSSENHRFIEAPGVPRHLIMSKHSRMFINPRKVPSVREMGLTRAKEKKTGRRRQCVRGEHRTVNCSMNSNWSQSQ